jgi:hypothetical protein
MPRIAFTVLFICFFLFSIDSFAEDTFTEINHYRIYDNHLSKLATVSANEKYIFDVNQHYEGPYNTSTTFEVFTKVEGKGYQQNQSLKLPEGLSQSFRGISHLIFKENYLLVIVDEINQNRMVHRFALSEQGQLSYLDQTTIEWTNYNNASNVVMLDEHSFYEYFYNSVSFWNIGEDGILNHQFDFDYYEQAGYDDFIPIVNGSKLLLVRMSKDLDHELHNFQVNQYSIDYENNSLNEIHSKTFSFGGEFNSSNINLLGAMVKIDMTSIYVRTAQQEFIFKGLGSEEISLEYRNDKNGYYFGIDQKTQQIFETGDVFNEVYIDWQNNEIIRSQFEQVELYGNLKFLTPTILLRLPQYESNKGDLWQISPNQKIDQINISVDNPGELPLDQQRKYLYDQTSHQLMVTGDANSSEENDFKLYVWDYNLAQNDFSYVGSANCCNSERISDSVITSPIGKYGENYYVITKDFTKTKIARMGRTTDGLELVQEFPLNDEETTTLLIDEVFFVDESTIVAELYADDIEGLLIKICTLDTDGKIIGCTKKTLFTEYEFERQLTGYKFHKLSNTGQFLFAPIQNDALMSHMFFVEFDGNDFVIKQKFPLNKNGNLYTYISKITLVNNNQDLFIRTGGPVMHFERLNNEWKLTESNQTDVTGGELTGNTNYYLTRSGLPTFYDREKKKFWTIYNQTKNLSGWFQLTDDNKGFAVKVNDQYRAITTFELTNSKPTIYTGGLADDLDYLATQDELLEIDFSQFFLNPNSSVVINAPLKFIFENGVLSGTLSNDDIIFGEYLDGIRIGVTVYNGSQYIGYFNIIPVNVNDAPELKAAISREYLKVNQAYEVNLNDYVNDPDRDHLTFQVTGLPIGYSLDGADIRGSTSQQGNYILNIITDDGNGGQLNFNIPITINSTGKEEAPDSIESVSSGSLGGLLIILYFAFITRLIKNRLDY